MERALALARGRWFESSPVRASFLTADAIAMDEQTDADMVADVLAGQRDVFASLVRKYQAHAYGTAIGILSDFELARDVVQEAFLAAYRDLRKLREPDRFAGWLHGIVRNRARSALRELRRVQELAEGADRMESRPSVADKTDRTGGMDEAVSEVSGNGQQVQEKLATGHSPTLIDRTELDHLFGEVRTGLYLHLRRAKEFHRTLHGQIDRLEESLTFELRRNEEVQQGLADILTGLGQDPEQTTKISIDARPRRGLRSRVRKWLAKLR